MSAAEGAPEPDARRAQLSANLASVRRRIADAVRLRPAAWGEPELIVVTKFHPAADVLLLAGLGVRDFGENRDQEAAGKSAEVALRLESGSARWHFIGQLQTNKAKSVAGYAHAVHSVDRPGLVRAMSTAVTAQQQRSSRADLLCFIQLNLDPSLATAAGAEAYGAAGSRGGALPAQALTLAELIDAAPGLRLAGVMAVAPLDGDPAEAFGRLQRISADVVARFPHATAISAGMSQDLEAAIAAGATHLRVGSDVLGPRPALR